MKYRMMISTSVVLMLGACFMPQVHDTSQNRAISLKAEDLMKHGVAFITPSTVTGQEEEKQEVAFTFAEVLKKERPSIICVLS